MENGNALTTKEGEALVRSADALDRIAEHLERIANLLDTFQLPVQPLHRGPDTPLNS